MKERDQGSSNTTDNQVEVRKIEFVNLAFSPDISNFERESISAVFLVGIKEDMILAARNERGWDIPGGHVDEGETDLLSTLTREVDEESGVLVNKATPFATMNFDGNDKSMLFYYSDSFELGDFIPKEDAFERRMMPVEEFLEVYNWKKDVMKEIIEYTQGDNLLERATSNS